MAGTSALATRRNRGRVMPIWILFAASGLISTAVTSAPLTSASPVVGIGTHRAPYSHVTIMTSQGLIQSRCSLARIVSPIHYSDRTARITVGVEANSTECAAVGGHRDHLAPIVTSTLFLGIPVNLKGLNRTISLNWSLVGKSTASVSPSAPCPTPPIPRQGYATQSCSISAAAYLVVDVMLLNSTGGQVWNPGLYDVPIGTGVVWWNITSCRYTGTCSYGSSNSSTHSNFSGTESFELNLSPPSRILRGHPGPYTLAITVEAQASVLIAASPAPLPSGPSAAATLDLKAPRFGLELTSIQVR